MSEHDDHEALGGIADSLNLDRDTVRAGTAIAEFDSGAAGFLAGVMQRNAEEAAAISDRIRAFDLAEIEKLKARAYRAEQELHVVRQRIESLIYPSEDAISQAFDLGE